MESDFSKQTHAISSGKPAQDFDLQKVVKNWNHELDEMIELEYGLLDDLVSRGLVDVEAVKFIESNATDLKRRNQLLDLIFDKLVTRPWFVRALKTANWRHVSLFIERQGRQFDENHQDSMCWPLDPVRKARIVANTRVLVEKLDPNYDLLYRLHSAAVINDNQLGVIKQVSSSVRRTRKLLNLLVKRSEGDYQVFQDCLRMSGQGHLARLLESSEEVQVKTSKPRQDFQRQLREVIDLELEFLLELISHGFQDDYGLVEFVKLDPASLERGRRSQLINLIAKKSQTEEAQEFKAALRAVNQKHVANCLERRGRQFERSNVDLKVWPLDRFRKSMIIERMEDLIEKIDPDDEFLDFLYSAKFIEDYQLDDLRKTLPTPEKTRKLLNLLLKCSVADYEVFMQCLGKVGQDHVAPLFENNSELIQDIDIKNWASQFEDYVEVDDRLLAELVSRELLRLDQLKADEFDKRDRLLQQILAKSITDHLIFLEALKNSNQHHIANFIRCNGRRHQDCECWPLDTKLKLRVVRNFPRLLEMIDSSDLFVCTLFSNSCINYLQKIDVEEIGPHYRRNWKLLNCLLQQSVGHYNIFSGALVTTGQGHLVEFFEKDVVIEIVDCKNKTRSGADDVRDEEARIVEQFAAIVKSETPRERRRLAEINGVVHRHCHTDVNLAAMRPGNSIQCYMSCGSLDALKILYERINDATIAAVLERVFTLLNGGVCVVKATGRLSESELEKRIEQFSKHLGLKAGVLSISTTTQLNFLPYEVLELILLRVSIALFKLNQGCLLVARPDIMTMTTTNSVCRVWCEVTASRKYCRRRLKRIFEKSSVLPVELLKAAVRLRHLLVDDSRTSRDADVIVLKALSSVSRRWKAAVLQSGDFTRRRVKRLFHYHPQLLVTLDQPPTHSNGDPREVRGVVVLDSNLYVAYWEYDKVEMFDDSFKKVRDIELNELQFPSDMVGCSVTSQLFVSQYFDDVIWRIDTKTAVCDVFVREENIFARSLSLVENRLLVRSRDSLYVYDTRSGEKMKNVALPEDMKGYYLWHALESNRNSFLVCRVEQSSLNTVSEINLEGRVVQVFKNVEQIHCNYLALDSVGRLLVADFDNGRVVLLDENLKYERLVFDKKRLSDAKPWRLHYDKPTDRLIVGLKNGQVRIFELNV